MIDYDRFRNYEQRLEAAHDALATAEALVNMGSPEAARHLEHVAGRLREPRLEVEVGERLIRGVAAMRRWADDHRRELVEAVERTAARV